MPPRDHVSLGVRSDYASLRGGNVSVYYGYEFGREEDPEDPGATREVWGLELKVDREVKVRIAQEELLRTPGCPDRWECGEMLLFGVGILLATGALVAPEVAG